MREHYFVTLELPSLITLALVPRGPGLLSREDEPYMKLLYEDIHLQRYVQRGATQIYWGYAVTLDFIREALSIWPTSSEGMDINTYDYWLYMTVRGERECVYPDVSRARHYGVGTNTQSYMHEYEAWRRPLLYDSNVPLVNVAQMPIDVYTDDLLKGLQGGKVVVGDPSVVCDSRFPHRRNTVKEKTLKDMSTHSLDLKGPILDLKDPKLDLKVPNLDLKDPTLDPVVPLIIFFKQESEDDLDSWSLLGRNDDHDGTTFQRVQQYVNKDERRNINDDDDGTTFQRDQKPKYDINNKPDHVNTDYDNDLTTFQRHQKPKCDINNNNNNKLDQVNTDYYNDLTSFHRDHKPDQVNTAYYNDLTSYQRDNKPDEVNTDYYNDLTSYQRDNKPDEVKIDYYNDLTSFQRVYYIGVPYSKYSYLMPDDATVFDVDSMSDQEIQDVQEKLSDTLSILQLNLTYYTYEELIREMFIVDFVV
ncbi:hypothetical protein Pcinc_008507 [Petrolisthes cinctipes]|uniref:Uncharacterized protein n=1 Tax=Petrolisthes cinctipes TaxID=88211 RepID=A0AAE1G8U7_PETCI|nr:hypothetical protein Pcinc_008507 [Petrolisthes cinctipes]